MAVLDAPDVRLAERHGIQLLVRFGSTVTGRTHASSDADYGVVLIEPTPGLSRLVERAADLQVLTQDVRSTSLYSTGPILCS